MSLTDGAYVTFHPFEELLTYDTQLFDWTVERICVIRGETPLAFASAQRYLCAVLFSTIPSRGNRNGMGFFIFGDSKE
jgi:hypothetical protein